MQVSLTIWSLVTPAFDLVRSCIGDLRRAGIHEVAGIYVVTRLFDLGVICFIYTWIFLKRLARTPRVPSEALLTGSHKKNCMRIYSHI